MQSGVLPLRSGILRIIREAQAKNWVLAIATTTTPANIDVLLRPLLGANCKQVFRFIGDAETAPFKKPNPAPLEYALTRLQTAPHNALMVGDSMNDALAAQAAGCACTILTYGYNEGVPMKEALAQQQLDIPLFDHFAEAAAV